MYLFKIKCELLQRTFKYFSLKLDYKKSIKNNFRGCGKIALNLIPVI